MKREYPDSKSDLFAAFIERCLSIVPLGGYAGLMTPFVWMFLGTYAPLRERLINREAISSLIQLEYSGFDGATVPVCAYVLHRGPSPAMGAFVRLADFVGAAVQGPTALEIIEDDRAACQGSRSNGMRHHLYRTATSEFAKVPGSPIAYWLSEKMRGAFTQPKDALPSVAFREGLSSSNNGRFVREWFEVAAAGTNLQADSRSDALESQKTWFPLDSGGGFRKWWGNQEVVINWRDDGADIFAERPRSTVRNPDKYFQQHITVSKISSGAPSFRLFPAGFVIASVSKCAFPDSSKLYWILGLLNSNVAHAMLAAKSPTLSFLASDMESIPLRSGEADMLTERVEQLTECSRSDWDSSEVSWNFTQNPLVTQYKTHSAHDQSPTWS